LPPLVKVRESPAPAASGEAGSGGVDASDPRRRLHGGLTTTREGNDENMPPPEGSPGRGARATRCPVCGRGDLKDVVFDGGTGEVEGTPMQLADSSEVDVYTCGHEVTGASLARADRSLHVERRASEDTVPPPEETSG
jgi:hypothetical protein